jgi:hypothetical protein
MRHARTSIDQPRQAGGRGRRLAVLVLTGVMVSAGTVLSGASAQAVAQPVEANALPTAWADYGQHIVSFTSGKCLQPVSAASQARVEQRTCTSPASLQRWKVIDAGDGHAMLVNQGSGLCLDLFANTDSEVVVGTPIQQFSCWTGYNTEHWARSRGSRADHFQVFTHIKALCLEVPGGSTADGAQLRLAACSLYQNAQQFKFVDAT